MKLKTIIRNTNTFGSRLLLLNFNTFLTLLNVDMTVMCDALEYGRF